MAGTTARITIRDNGRAHTLFSISERRTGDIFVALKLPSTKNPRARADTIVLAKFTIHPSPESKTNINAIQWTLHTATGEKIRKENYTKAIKARDGFVPIGYFRIRRPSQFTVTQNDKATSYSIGEMNSQFSTLYLCLVISDESVVYPEMSDTDFSVTRFCVGATNFTIIASYAPLQSHHSFECFISVNLPPEIGSLASDVGVDANTVIENFRQLRLCLYDQFGRNMLSTGWRFSQGLEFRVRRRFFCSGIPGPSWR